MYPNQSDATAAGSGRGKLPSKASLDYIKVAIEVLLLLLAIPWLLKELTRHPGRVSRGAAKKHLGPSS